MKAGPVTIRELLQTRQRFCVPIYQRHYVWNQDKQWEPFWNDIRTKAIERLNNRERRFSHFMGAVVLEARLTSTSKQVTSFQVVDGQQRLTTFQLFLAAARDYASGIELNKTARHIDLFILNESQDLMENSEVEKFKVWPTKYDRELFQDIITAGRSELRKKYSEYFYKKQDKILPYKNKVPKLLGAYGFFFDSIKNAVESDELVDDFAESNVFERVGNKKTTNTSKDSELRLTLISDRLHALWEALIEEFKVVEIRLEEGDDAQVIFETLNERGEPLLAADLVRNNIFHRADARQENAELLFEKYWKVFEDPFWSTEEKQGRYKKARIEFFLANFIAGKIASEVTMTKLFSEYKSFIKIQANKSNGGYAKVRDELQDLCKFGNLYQQLVKRNHDDPLGNFAERLYPWEVTTVYPLVLRLWSQDSMEIYEKKQCLEYILTYIVRRAICGKTTKNYNKFFLSVLRHLELNGFTQENFLNYLKSQTYESSRFPNDEEFKNSWIDLPVYRRTMSSHRVRIILEAIERKKREKFHETQKLAEYLTVEHILPMNWENHWPLPNGGKPERYDYLLKFSHNEEDGGRIGEILRRERLLNTFGNLTLLTKSLNSSIKNSPFQEKRRALDEHSLLVLNKEILRYNHWDEDCIIERGKALFEIALNLWPYPT